VEICNISSRHSLQTSLKMVYCQCRSLQDSRFSAIIVFQGSFAFGKTANFV